jgi:hypothetical protein
MSEKMTSQNKLTEIKLVPYNKPHKNDVLYIIQVGLCIMEILDNERNRATVDWGWYRGP